MDLTLADFVLFVVFGSCALVVVFTAGFADAARPGGKPRRSPIASFAGCACMPSRTTAMRESSIARIAARPTRKAGAAGSASWMPAPRETCRDEACAAAWGAVRLRPEIMNERRVVITGIGCISPLGNDLPPHGRA